MLDAGHGGHDSGAIGKGILEKDIALSVTLKIGAILKAQNVDISYTRTTDVFIDLTERSLRANKERVDAFVSVHVNDHSSVMAKGVETFKHTSNNKSNSLAKNIQDKLLSDRMYSANRGVKQANFSVLRKTSMEAALVELGFIRNVDDVKILINEQDALALSVAKGILAYLSIGYNAPTSESKGILYKVQSGAYAIKSNAEKLVKELKDKGISSIIVKEDNQVIDSCPDKLVSYNARGGARVIEVEPKDLFIDVVKEVGTQIKGDFVNGGFYDMDKMVSISTLVSDGKVISEQLAHDNVKRGTLVVRNDGSVSVEMVDFISKSPGLKDIKFAISGFNIMPSHGNMRSQLKSEWFDYDKVGYRTTRTMIGYSSMANKVLIVVVPSMDAQEGMLLMKELGCVCAIGLDSGVSSNGRFNGTMVRLTNRRLHNVIRWCRI